MAFIDPYEVYVLSENPDNLRGKNGPIMLHVKGIGDPLYSMMWQDLSRRLYHSALFSLGR